MSSYEMQLLHEKGTLTGPEHPRPSFDSPQPSEGIVPLSGQEGTPVRGHEDSGTSCRPHSVAIGASEQGVVQPGKQSAHIRRVKSAFVKSATSSAAQSRKGFVPMATTMFPPQERTPKTYDEALKKYGWKFEVHNDPLNIKYGI